MKNYHTFDELIKLINASGKAYNIELINKAYNDSEISGKEYERVVRYVESILADKQKDKQLK